MLVPIQGATRNIHYKVGLTLTTFCVWIWCLTLQSVNITHDFFVPVSRERILTSFVAELARVSFLARTIVALATRLGPTLSLPALVLLAGVVGGVHGRQLLRIQLAARGHLVPGLGGLQEVNKLVVNINFF